MSTVAAAREDSGELTAQRDAPLGGQAVLEGVMMRGVSNWAVAVRKPAENVLAGDEGGRMQKLLDALENLDDVQDVYTTAVIDQ